MTQRHTSEDAGEHSEALAKLSPAVRAALESRGFTALTPVQRAVLDSSLHHRDLRISSQTGSGKTVALGLVLAPELERLAKASVHGKCTPLALVIVPTRELAAQVRTELFWLFEKANLRVTAVTGGTSVPLEIKELRRGPHIVVGTPGRLLDHLERKIIDTSHVHAVVLDEADEMLDLGFRDELESILAKLPEKRRTHLVSATFSKDVLALAAKYQHDAVAVEGTRLGAANADIAHVVHLVAPSHRTDALVNLLLRYPDDQVLVFVRTRTETALIARELSLAGFSAAALSGEMEQKDRTHTLAAFKRGTVRVLVATDVAARGIDVQDIARVIHADPPTDPDIYTHRSGRTGRAGKKGFSVVLCPPSNRERLGQILRKAKVEAEWKPLPSAEEILALHDERFLEELTAPAEPPPRPRQERLERLAARLLEESEPQAVVMRLIQRLEKSGGTLPRDIPEAPVRAAKTHAASGGKPWTQGAATPTRTDVGQGFVPFRINWGKAQGADPRPLLAMICKRGNIRGKSVGSIRIGLHESVFGIAEDVAPQFAAALRKSEGDGRTHIEPVTEKSSPGRPGFRPRRRPDEQ